LPKPGKASPDSMASHAKQPENRFEVIDIKEISVAFLWTGLYVNVSTPTLKIFSNEKRFYDKDLRPATPTGCRPSGTIIN
jgi:hypothetical protein